MGNTLKSQQTRNYLWDNMKVFLIFTVVLGHFFEKGFPKENLCSVLLDYWIYTFHMPAFLFISGFWSKGYCRNSRVRVEKVCYFISYYAIFQVLFFLMNLIFNPDKRLTLFVPEIGLWYLFAMAVYYLLIPLAEKIPAYFGLMAFGVLGLLIGTEEKAGSFMTISRLFVFAPFFFLGYYTPEKLINKLRNFKLRFVAGIFATFVSVSIWALIMKYKGMDALPMTIFYGKKNYPAMDFSTFEGIGLRALSWIIGLLMILSMVLLTTEKKTPFSYIGQRSLQIYLFHFFLVIFMDKTTFTENFPIETILQCGLVVLLAIVVTLILSVKPLSYPFAWIQKLVDKIFVFDKKGE